MQELPLSSVKLRRESLRPTELGLAAWRSKMKRFGGKFWVFLRTDPTRVARAIVALICGTIVAVRYRITTRRVRIGLPFFAYGRVSISGPGRVSIEPGCAVHVNGFDGLSIVTLDPNAAVRIGRGGTLGGLSIRAMHGITLEEHVMTANCLIQDFMYVAPRFPGVMAVSKEQLTIDVQEGAWLAGQTVVLAGGRIGKNSVLGTGGLCVDQEIPENRVAIGNPIRGTVSIDAVNAMRATE